MIIFHLCSRYLEKYQIKERRANGVIVAVPVDEAARSTNECCNGNSTTLNALEPQKKQIREAIPGDQRNGSKDKGGLKSTLNSILTNGENDNTKKRKQGRKRGKKSKSMKKTNECKSQLEEQ